MRILLGSDTLTVALVLTVAQTPWLPTCRGKQGYLFIGSYLSEIVGALKSQAEKVSFSPFWKPLKCCKDCSCYARPLAGGLFCLVPFFRKMEDGAFQKHYK